MSGVLLAVAVAQIVTSGQQIQRQPPRDAVPTQTGTAVIRGRVFAADTGRPLRRARITLNAPELGSENRTTSTNADGRYEFKDLPGGRYSITASRSGYLMLRFGQRRPLEQGKPLHVLDRQTVENVDFTLPRMSLMTGRILDEQNEPVQGVQVFVMRSAYFEGRRRLVPASTALTDDAGQYRILGLPPGTYFLMANLRETWTVVENGVEQTLGYSQTYFPGTTNVSDARRVTVGLGQEAANIDFNLVPGRAANVAGTAVDSRGRPLVGQQIGLGQEFRGPQMAMMFSNQSATVGADGTFTIKNVPPGEYKLQARATVEGKAPNTQIQEAGTAVVLVNGVDVDNVSIMTSSGGSISGVIVADTGAAPSMPHERARVVARPVSGDLDPRMGPPGGTAGNGIPLSNWTFFISGVFGPARLRVTLPDGWAVKTILVGDRDLGEAPIELRSGEELTGVQVVVTNTITTISGQLTDDKGTAVTDGTVIVFADAADKWSEDSRFVRSARPDQQGQYQIKGLPAGDYLAVAVDYVQEGMWNDPEYLESLRRAAQRVMLAEGDAKAVTLKLTSLGASP